MRGYFQYYMHDLVNTLSRRAGGLPTNFHHGQVTVTTAGTAVVLKEGSVPLVGGIWFKPLTTTKMYVGYAAQKPDGSNSITCDSSNPLFLEASDLNDYWIDAASDDTVMSFLAF